MKLALHFSKKLSDLSDAEWASPIFEKYGEFVARHPRKLIAISICLTMLLSLGALRITVKDDLRFMYTPPKSPSFDEFRIHMDFQKFHNLTYAYFYVMAVSPVNRGNVLNENVANLLLKANAYIFNNLTLRNFLNNDNSRVNFGTDLCPLVPMCRDSNRAMEVFLQAYFDPDDGYFTNDSNSNNITDDIKNKFTYPVSNIFNVNVFLASHLYDVQLSIDNSIKSAGLIHLTYFYPIRYENDVDSIREFESTISSYLQEFESDEVRFYTFSMNKLQREVAANTFRTLPYLPLSVMILIIYTLWTTIRCSDIVRSKPVEGLMGVCTTLLAVVSAYGLMFLCGVPYNSTVAVVPFLTLALAVDDTYIMLAAWRETNIHLENDKRLGKALSSAGCAITAAMLTDVFAFVVGTFSNTPAIEHFCLFITTAVLFDYLYQLTFFSAFLSISGQREAAGRHCLFFWLPADHIGTCGIKRISPIQRHASKSICSLSKQESETSNGFLEHLLKRNYVSVLLDARFRIIALFLYFAYVGFALWGCVGLTVNLTPSKLLVHDSELDRYMTLSERYIWTSGLIVIVYVQNSPNFGSIYERNRFDEFLYTLENTPYSLGPQSTTLWLNDYRSFLDYLQVNLDESEDAFYNKLPSFLQFNDKQRWKKHLRLSNRTYRSIIDKKTNKSIPIRTGDHTIRVDSFFFTTGFRLSGWSKLLDLVQTWRRICANYSDYQAVVYDEENFYADQIDSLAPNVIQDTGIAFFCMIIAGALFIPNARILFFVTWSLFSMNFGVIGFLAWWGCDLDPTAVTSILLSIGLAVDFTIHVAYHYHRVSSKKMKSDCRNEKEKRRRILEETLSAAGWPLFQGGLSTLLAVVALIFVPSYVISVFLRTVLLVVLLGLVHALVYLPIVLVVVSLDEPRRKLLNMKISCR